MQSKHILFSCLLAAGLMSCKKNEIDPLPLKDLDNTTNVKIVHASAYLTNYSVHLKVNDQRITNAFTYSTPFPGGGLNTGGSNFPWYFALNPGQSKITLAVPNVGRVTDSIMLYTGNVTLDAGKYYSVYLADTLTKTQAVVVPENKAIPADKTTRFKFVNLIPNVAAIDLYFAGNVVAANIPFKGVSPEFILPYTTAGQWAIRPAGAAPTSTAIAVYPTGTGTQTIPNQRIMTVYSRGYSGVTTGNRVPAISLLYN
ncbi:MAG TPA: DUF4397 domain-containing protein [Flavisolibacter sp.]|nr:DUF4397 domain-containing protein [Flavisolibacter sp.]